MTAETPQHDLLIVHGKNWNRHRFSRSKPIELSEASKINALAAARAYELGLVGAVLFSTGKTAGENAPSEAKAMFKYLKGMDMRFPHLLLSFKRFPLIQRQKLKKIKK